MCRDFFFFFFFLSSQGCRSLSFSCRRLSNTLPHAVPTGAHLLHAPESFWDTSGLWASRRHQACPLLLLNSIWAERLLP